MEDPATRARLLLADLSDRDGHSDTAAMLRSDRPLRTDDGSQTVVDAMLAFAAPHDPALIATIADLHAVTGELLRYAREGAACDSFAIEPETFPQLANAVRVLCDIEEPVARRRNDAAGAEALGQFRHGAFLLTEEWAS